MSYERGHAYKLGDNSTAIVVMKTARMNDADVSFARDWRGTTYAVSLSRFHPILEREPIWSIQ